MTFYAATVRKDKNGFPPDGFQPRNKVSRKAALYAMTRWAASACFEEQEKGSLETGKLADFVVLDNDLMKVPDAGIPATKVLFTFVGGEQVFPR
jgi:predicted amidohydrolase YtcJ